MNAWLNTLAIGMPGATELIVIGIIGLLIFGKRLPEVGKSLGKSIVEFKKGLRGIEDDIEKGVNGNQADMLPPPNEHNESDSSSDGSSSRSGSTQETVSQGNQPSSDD